MYEDYPTPTARYLGTILIALGIIILAVGFVAGAIIF